MGVHAIETADADDAISSDSREPNRGSGARISPPEWRPHSTRLLARSAAVRISND
jgi:hypothetical protein